MNKKIGNYLVNARIDINYVNHKPKVKISYPVKDKKKAQEKGIIFSTYFLKVLFIIFVILFLSLNQIIMYNSQKNLTNCNGTFFPNNSKNSGMFLNCSKGNYTILFQLYKPLFGNDFLISQAKQTNSSIWIILEEIFLIIISFINSFTITFLIFKNLLKKKWFKIWFPKSQVSSKKWRYYKFYPKDVENNQVYIHNFSNIVLDYKTKGDFSKYLKSIKIREQRYYIPKKIKGKVRKGKLKKDLFNWFVKFTFSKKPKDGFLKVNFQ